MANRLQHEDSPYLQQHKNNPVEWYPWCDEAFQKAKEENKAIFISIGYSSCHWCHVMEEKVFENEECAKILNDHFISIKVDREERPDIDRHYQEVYQLLNRRAGGWPTSIFATPQNKVFFAGTYIPPRTEGTNIAGMGFLELSSIIAKKIEESDPKLLQNAEEISGFLEQKSPPKEATVLKEEILANFMKQVKSNYDTKYGGFSVAPKFPQAATLLGLLYSDKLYNDKAAAAMLKDTLFAMRQGGMYDLVDGGFCRYSVDEMWLVPHFEKMLYDNALLCEVYTLAGLHFSEDLFIQTATECADFWLEFMSEEKLFYSASDADSQGEEGTYFIYSYDEIYTSLQEQDYKDIQKLLDSMNVTHHGNFEGKNIIRFDEKTPPSFFEKIRPHLQEIRKTREYPFVDKKIQTSWSSMMIKSLFTLGSVDAKYIKEAQESLDALLKSMYLDGVLYHTTLIHKTPKIEAFLEDYAFLASALLQGYKVTQEEIYLIQAQHFANTALEKFYKNGEWFFSTGEFETQAEIYDNTYTSSVSVMIDVLLSLSSLLDDEKYSRFAFKTLEYNSYELARRPIYSPYMLMMMLRHLKGDRIVKSKAENLKTELATLSTINYPFTLFKADENQEFMICGKESCFANTDDATQVEVHIQNSLS